MTVRRESAVPEPASYRPGALCWADLLTPRPEAAERFYAAVLGWEYVHAGPVFDHYTYATARRHMVAGMAPTGEMAGSWIVCFATDGADRLSERIAAAGGEVTDGPRDFGVQGRSLSAIDAAGAHVGFWQARAHMGAGLLGEPGALCWAELAVRDTAAADRFYCDVLGFRVAEHPAAGDEDYAAFRLSLGAGRGDEPVAGRTVLAGDGDGNGGGAEPFWMPYFGVPDAARAARVAEREGATVLHAGADATGRALAVLSDPWGAVFAILQLPPG
jgi:uncharacterized protein